MKLILKILFAPVILVLWIGTGILFMALKLSGVVLHFLAILFGLCAVISLFEGNYTKALTVSIIAFLFSPYGLPTVAALLLARFYYFRFWLKDKIYG